MRRRRQTLTRGATNRLPTPLEIQEFRLWDRIREKRVPVNFDLEITARCNQDCGHCYINRPADDRAALSAELTPDEIAAIADQAVALGSVWCLVTGGEPLLRADFQDIYLRLKRKGLLVSVFTNAALIRDAHIDLFRKYPPRDVEVTVYGVTAETYERVTRRPGSFAAFMEGLNRLMDGGIRVRLKAMALRSNLHELPAIAAFCRSRTKDFFRFDPQLHLRFDGDQRRNSLIRAERLTPGEIVAIDRSDGERLSAMRKGGNRLINEAFTRDGSNLLFRCGAGRNSFSVGADGMFRLCSSLWAPGTTADLRRMPLREAWENHAPRIRDIRSDRPEYLDACRRCELVNLCLWCPAHAHLETGALDAPVDYFCEVAHARAASLRNETRDPESAP
jgi:radical SAM protein with 4Fe4S-binding SPASM domain